MPKKKENQKIISFKKVTKKYPDGGKSLDNVTFDVKEGEFVFFVGASGAGKTTLMRHIVKEETPTEGSIIIDGDDISSLKNTDVPKLRRKVGYIFQDFKLLNSKTVSENIALPLEVVGKTKKDIDSLVPNLLHLVGLGDMPERFPPSLSGGEMQRLSIARALAHEPRILLADEPTGNLDSTSTWVVVDLIKKINEWGTTILFGTHDTDIVNTLKKRVIQLDAGRIVEDTLKNNGNK